MTPLASRQTEAKADAAETAAWLPQFACPECGGPLRADGPSALVCRGCVLHFEQRDGIHRFLTVPRAEAAAGFLRQYRSIRGRDGYGSASADYYRNLPTARPDDPRAAEWCVRRRSYAHLRHHAIRPMMRGRLRVLDLGAGCGWLSHRLARLGHFVVAADRQDDDRDGLQACRHYEVPFPTVQLDFNALPFAPAQFDLVVFAASLHYSQDPLATLAHASRMLAPGGVLAVMDSPMFARERDGLAMLEQQARRMEVECGVTSTIAAGVGFLTYATLGRAAALVGASGRFHRSRVPFMWRLQRHLARLRLTGPRASFGVWVAR